MRRSIATPPSPQASASSNSFSALASREVETPTAATFAASPLMPKSFSPTTPLAELFKRQQMQLLALQRVPKAPASLVQETQPPEPAPGLEHLEPTKVKAKIMEARDADAMLNSPDVSAKARDTKAKIEEEEEKDG